MTRFLALTIALCSLPAFADLVSITTGNLPAVGGSVKALPVITSTTFTVSSVCIYPPGGDIAGECTPGLQVAGTESYNYASTCSTGGRGARSFPCTRSGSLAAAQTVNPFHSGTPLIAKYTFVLNAPVNSLQVTSTVSAPGIFNDTVQLSGVNGVITPVSSAAGLTFGPLPAGTYTVEVDTSAFTAYQVSVTIQ